MTIASPQTDQVGEGLMINLKEIKKPLKCKIRDFNIHLDFNIFILIVME